MKYPTTDTLLMWFICNCKLQPYRDITYVWFCRLINVDILLLFLTILIRYKTEMHGNRHIADAINMHLFKFIYRSYIYMYISWKFNSFISIELWPSGYDGGLVSWRPCRVGDSNPIVDKIVLQCSLVQCSSQLDWQRSNEIKHDIHPT